jgi:Protein of unknown function (DUF2934)
MARDVASTQITGNEPLALVGEPPVVQPAASADPAMLPATKGPVAKGKMPRPLFLVPHRLTVEERHRRICELAYRRAEQRGFAPGGEIEDWLEAEREVDAGRF